MEKKIVTYQQFLEGYKTGDITVSVNKKRAGDFVMSGFGDKNKRRAHVFWTWTGLIVMIPLAILLLIFKGWIYAAASFFIGRIINNAALKSAGEFVLENMRESEDFWDYVLLHKGAIMQDKEGNEITSAFLYRMTNRSDHSVMKMNITSEQQTELNRLAEASKINPQHARAMADGSIVALKKANLEE
jgi:hypothetical protein